MVDSHTHKATGNPPTPTAHSAESAESLLTKASKLEADAAKARDAANAAEQDARSARNAAREAGAEDPLVVSHEGEALHRGDSVLVRFTVSALRRGNQSSDDLVVLETAHANGSGIKQTVTLAAKQVSRK